MGLVICLIFSCIIVGVIILRIQFPGHVEDLPIILEWTSQGGLHQISCGNYVCLATSERQYLDDPNLAAIAFYGSSINVVDLPLPRGNRTWAVLHEESSRNRPWLAYKEGQSIFNVSATFSNRSNYPIMLEYINAEIITTLKYYVPFSVKRKLKLAPVLYLQSICENPIQRDSYVQELMEYVDVDSYGECLNNKKLPDVLKLVDNTYHLFQDDLINFTAQYKFVINIENCICDDYITEKIWRTFSAGSIPIYLGAPNIKDWLPNNQSALIITDFLNMRELADYINLLSNNDLLYLKFMQHKLSRDKKITNKALIAALSQEGKLHGMEKLMCHLCTDIHRNVNYKSTTNMMNCHAHGNEWSDAYQTGKCSALVVDKFVNKLQRKNYTEKEFNDEVHKMMIANLC